MLSAIDRFCDTHHKTVTHREYMKVMTSMFYTIDLKFNKGKNKKIVIYSGKLSEIFTSFYNTIKGDCLTTTLNHVERFDKAKGKCNAYALKGSVIRGAIINYQPVVPPLFVEKLKNIFLQEMEYAYRSDRIYGDRRVENQNNFLLQLPQYYNETRAIPLLIDLFQQRIITSQQAISHNLQLIRGFEKEGKYYIGKPDRDGRLYGILCYTKSQCRSLLAEDYQEIDLKNSHPFCISSILHFLLTADKQKLNRESNFIGMLKQQLINHLQTEQAEFKQTGLGWMLNTDFKNMSNLQLMEALWERMGNSDNKIFLNCVNNLHYHILKSLLIITHIYFIHSVNTNQVTSPKMAEEIESLHLHAINEGLYDYVVEKNKDEMSLFYKHRTLAGDEYQELTQDLLTDKICRNIAKKSFMFWLNDKGMYVKSNVFFRKSFPQINLLFRQIKQQFGKTALHSLVTSAEANFIFKVIDIANTRTNQGRPFKVGSVHDAFYVPLEKTALLQEIINTQSHKVFNCQSPFKVKTLALTPCRS